MGANVNVGGGTVHGGDGGGRVSLLQLVVKVCACCGAAVTIACEASANVGAGYNYEGSASRVCVSSVWWRVWTRMLCLLVGRILELLRKTMRVCTYWFLASCTRLLLLSDVVIS